MAISSAIVGQQSVVRLVGGIFLFYLGLRTALSHPALDGEPRGSTRAGGRLRVDVGADTDQSDDDPLFRRGLRRAGAGDHGGRPQMAVLMVCGVFLGSALWWLLLSGTVGFFRRR